MLSGIGLVFLTLGAVLALVGSVLCWRDIRKAESKVNRGQATLLTLVALALVGNLLVQIGNTLDS